MQDSLSFHCDDSNSLLLNINIWGGIASAEQGIFRYCMELGYSTALWHSKPSSDLSGTCWQCYAPCVREHIGRKGIQPSPWQQVILLQRSTLCQKLSQNGLLQKYQICVTSCSMMSSKDTLLACFV